MTKIFFMENISAVIVAKNHSPFLLKVIDSVSDLVETTIIVDIGMSPELEKQLKSKKVKIIKLDQEVSYVELIREKTKDFEIGRASCRERV